MAARARYPRIRIADPEPVLRHGAETSEVVVRGTRQQTREGDRDVEPRPHVLRPLVALVVARPLAGEFVGIGAVEPRGFRRSVELHEELVLRGLAQDLLLDADHLLIVAVHEVDHHAPHAPPFEEVERLVDPRIERLPVDPQVDAHPLRSGVVADGLHVERLHGARYVGRRRGELEAHVPVRVPRLLGIAVDRVVFDPAAGGEVDVVLVGHEVAARKEGRVGHRAAVPPRKGGLAGPDPRGVGHGARIVQTREDVRCDERAGIRSDHRHAPRRAVRQLGPHLLSLLPRQRRELAPQGPLLAHQVHARIIPHGGFGESHADASVVPEQGGHLDELALVERTARPLRIEPFVRGGVGVQIHRQHFGVAGRVERGQLVVHDIGFPSLLLGKLVAESRAVVEHAHHEVDPAMRRLAFEKRDPRLVVGILHMRALAGEEVVALHAAAADDAARAEAAAEGPAVELEAQTGPLDKRHSSVRDVVSRKVLPGQTHRHADAAAGRLHGRGFLSVHRPAHRKNGRTQCNEFFHRMSLFIKIRSEAIHASKSACDGWPL